MAGLQREIGVASSVASAASQTPVDNTIAEAIGLAEQTFTTVRKGRNEDALLEGLDELSQDAVLVSQGKDVKNFSERMKRLKIAKDQGKGSSQVKIEAEALLKEAIDSMPVFETELRQMAAREVGFDPTGATIKARFEEFAPSQREKLSPLQQKEQHINEVASRLGIDPTPLINSNLRNEVAELTLETLETKSRLGSFDIKEASSSFRVLANNTLADSSMRFFEQIKAGGVLDEGKELALLQADRIRFQSDMDLYLHRNNINASSAEATQLRQEMDQRFNAQKELITSGSLKSLQTNHADTAASLIASDSYRFNATSRYMREVHGESGYAELLKLQGKSRTQSKMLQTLNPALKGLINDFDAASKRYAKGTDWLYKVPPVDLPSTDDDRIPLSDGEKEVAFVNSVSTIRDKGMRNTALDSYMSEDKVYKLMGAYFKPGVYGITTKEERKEVSVRFNEEYEELSARASALLVKHPENSMSINSSGDIDVARVSPSGNLPPNSELSGITSRLNLLNKGVQTGWANEFGQKAGGFNERTVNRITTVSAESESDNASFEAAVQAFREAPTKDNFELIRSIDPDFAASVESRRKTKQGNSDANTSSNR